VEFLIFGAEGKTLLVKADVGKEFSFEFRDRNQRISLKGVIEETDEGTFKEALERIKMKNPDFQSVTPAKKPYVFRGNVNGSLTILPVKGMEEVVRDVISKILPTAKFKRLS